MCPPLTPHAYILTPSRTNLHLPSSFCSHPRRHLPSQLPTRRQSELLDRRIRRRSLRRTKQRRTCGNRNCVLHPLPCRDPSPDGLSPPPRRPGEPSIHPADSPGRRQRIWEPLRWAPVHAAVPAPGTQWRRVPVL